MADNTNEMNIVINGTAKKFEGATETVKKKTSEVATALKNVGQISEQEFDKMSKAADRAASQASIAAAKAANEIYKSVGQSTEKSSQYAKGAALQAQYAAEASTKAAADAANASARSVEDVSKKTTEATLAATKDANDQLQQVVGNAAKASAVAFAATTAAIGLVTSQFADYQKALVSVGIVTQVNGEALDAFGKKFQDMSKKIPVSTNDLLGIAQAAGRLGVRGEEGILKFTDTIAKLGLVTNLSGEDVAVQLTRILTLTGEGAGNIDKFGSVIVALRNNFAVSEAELVKMSESLSRSTAVFGLSSAQVAGLSAGLRSMGVAVEAGGTAVGKAMRNINAAIESGGAPLKNLSSLTGIAAGDLKKAFKDNATDVFIKFLEGLKGVQESGGNTSAVLKDFNLSGERLLKTLPVIALHTETLSKALKIAGDEMQNTTALNDAVGKSLDTLSADTTQLKNDFTTMAVRIGEELAPAIHDLATGVASIVNHFSSADSGGIKLIATMLRIAFAVTGAIAGVASAALAYLSWGKIVEALTLSFEVARGAVIGFTSAATLGLSVVLAFLPEIISGIGKLYDSVDRPVNTDSLDEITRKIAALKKEREGLDGFGGTAEDTLRIKAIDDEIEALKRLQQEKIRSSKDFGTGEVLVQPKVADLNSPFQFEAQSTVLDPNADKRIEEHKRGEYEKTQAANKGTEKRLANAKAENAKLLSLQQEKNSLDTKEEQQFAKRRVEIQNEQHKALIEKDQTTQNVLLENARIKNEILLQDEQKYYDEKEVKDIENNDRKKARDQELRDFTVEQRAQFTQEDYDALAAKIETENDLEHRLALDKANKKILERNKFAEEEKKHGVIIANISKFLASEEVQNFRNGTDELAQLANSRHATLKGIGKAAARINAAMATAEGAIKAYSSLAGIPIVGPALGAAAAAAVIAYGVERQEQISALASGGIVPNSIGGKKDRTLIAAEPGELVVPKAVTPNFIQSMGIPDTQSNPSLNNQNNEPAIITLELQDRVAEIVTLNQRQGKALGIIGQR